MQTRCAVGLILLFLLGSALVGCHDGGSETKPITISGMASKGPIRGGTVQIFAIRDGAEDRSVPIGRGGTDDNGNFTINIGAYAGPILVEVTGGSFTDEVSGASVTMKAVMRAVSNILRGAQTVAITPLTELAYKKASGAGGLSSASIDDANTKLASFFGLSDIISTIPVAGGTGDDQKKYAAVLGSFAQYVNVNKNQNESLDDALPRLLAQMGDEVKNTGGFSIGTINKINVAISLFNGSGKNKTGADVALLPAPASGLLKLKTAGTSIIGAVDVTVDFPAGVTISADAASGEVTDGVVISGAAATADCLSTAKFTPVSGIAPAQLHLGLITVTGFGPGEFVTIKFDVDPGTSFPLDERAFSLAGFSIVGTDGSAISGMSVSPATVAAEIK